MSSVGGGRRLVALIVALALHGCVQELPGYAVCGAATCGAGEYRLCAEDDDGAAPAENEDRSCAPLRGLGEPCSDAPCSDAATSVGLCDNGLACRDGVCASAGYLYDLCLDDAGCTSGLQCWPWWKHYASDPSPRPSACDVPYFGPIADDWFELTGTPIDPPPVAGVPFLATGVCFPKAVDGMPCDTGCFDCADGLDCVAGVCERPCTDAADCCRGGAAGTCGADQHCDICHPSGVPLAQCGTGGIACCRAAENHSCTQATLVDGSTRPMCCVPTGSAVACDNHDDCCDGARCNPATSRCQACVRDGRPVPPGGICCDGMAPGPDPTGEQPGNFCLTPCTEVEGAPCRRCGGTGTPTYRGTWVCTITGSRCVDNMVWPTTDSDCDGVDDDCNGDVDEDQDDDSDDDCDGVDDDCSGGFGGTDPDEIDEDFPTGDACTGATVPGCSGTWNGARRCAPGDPSPLGACVAEAGEDYCKAGNGVAASESPDSACGPGGGWDWDTESPSRVASASCCYDPARPTELSPTALGDGASFLWNHGEFCKDQYDRCGPDARCGAVQTSTTVVLRCRPRQASCTPYCWEPDELNNSTTAGESCGVP